MRLSSTNTILVPTDFTDASEAALTAGSEMAELLKASVEVLHVSATPLAVELPPGSIAPVQIQSEASEQAESAQLENAAKRLRLRGITCSTARTVGSTHAEIIDHAVKIGAGLIILGSHEHHGLAATFLGHVSEKVVRHAPCPVLVIPVAAEQTATIPSDDPLGLSLTAPLAHT